MKGFLDWFKNSTKIKRWLFVILLGVVAFCYGVAEVITLKELGVIDIIRIVVSFVAGFVFIITGFIFSQKRLLEIVIESTSGHENIKEKKNIKIDKLIFNKNIYNSGPKIVVIGGGTGLASVLSGLKNYTSNITAIAPMIENNSIYKYSTNTMELAPTDGILNSFVSLSREDVVMNKLLNYNFTSGNLRGINFGDVYISAMKDIYNNFSEGIEGCGKTLNIVGNVIPVTYDEIVVCAEFDNGTIVEGQAEIENIMTEKVMEIKRIFLKPSALKPVPAAIKAIEEADAIVIGPGALYKDIIPNLLVKDIAKTIKQSKAIRIYISNIMTEPSQTQAYSLYDYVTKLQEHAGKDILDYCICDTGEIVPEFVRKYNLEGSDILLTDIEKLKAQRINVIQEDLSNVQGEYIRHNPDKLAENIIKIIIDQLEFKNKQNTLQYFLLKHVAKIQSKKVPKKKAPRKPKRIAKKSDITKKRTRSKFNQKYKTRIDSIKNSDVTRQQNLEMSKKIEKIAKDSSTEE